METEWRTTLKIKVSSNSRPARTAFAAAAALLLAVMLIPASTGCFMVDQNMVRISGSTTLLPTAQEGADLFMERNPGEKVLVQGGGSSVGVSQLKQGLVNIACTSRELKEGEDDGTFVDYKVALDVIAIVINPSNGVTGLSREQVKGIFTGELTNWSEVGGADKPIVVVVRDQASGTRQMFDEKALGEGVSCINSAIECNSNGIVRETVAATDNAIGYVSPGFVNADVKSVDYNGVPPAKDTARDGSYPLSRFLHMFTRGQPEGRVKDYLDLVMSEEFQLSVVAREYIPVFEE
jgi:phosphate transport system substrate-binding protein